MVDIIGVGVNGRVFSGGPHGGGKLVLIEAYSVADSTVYQLPMNNAKLMQFLREAGTRTVSATVDHPVLPARRLWLRPHLTSPHLTSPFSLSSLFQGAPTC